MPLAPDRLVEQHREQDAEDDGDRQHADYTISSVLMIDWMKAGFGTRKAHSWRSRRSRRRIGLSGL